MLQHYSVWAEPRHQPFPGATQPISEVAERLRCHSRATRWARRAQQEAEGVYRVASFPLHLNRRVGIIKAAHHDAEHVYRSIVEISKGGREFDAGESWIPVGGRPRNVIRTQAPAVDAAIRGRDARERVSPDGDVLGPVPAVVGDFESDCRLRTAGHVTQILNDEAGTLLRAASRRR